MRAVLQRVSSASLSIEGEVFSEISRGLLVLLGIGEGDGLEDIAWLAGKVAGLRIFADEEGRMNRSLLEIKGEALIVSQFTLHASTRKGKRPSFIRAAGPSAAIPLYESFLEYFEQISGIKPATGVFGADMQVALVNDGPVTIIIDTKNRE